MNPQRLHVEKVVNGGYGLARLADGRVMLLHGALPGEEVSFRPQGRRGDTLFGTAETIFTPHKERITPPCPYYGECGGCDLQHCSYEGQLELKRAILAELLDREAAAPADPVPSPRQFGYRQRIRLQVDANRLGYRRFRSTAVVPVEECLIAHPAINHVLALLPKNRWFDRLRRNALEVELHYDPGAGAVDLLFNFSRSPRPADRQAAVSLSAADGLRRIFFKGDGFALEGPYGRHDFAGERARTLDHSLVHPVTGATLTMAWEIDGFAQVNLAQNRRLVDHVVRRIAQTGGATVLDLYCGMGNFSVPLAALVEELVGVEGQGSGIRCARRNCAAAGLLNASFRKGPVAEICRRLQGDGRCFDITVMDPPRQGIPGLAATVAALTGRLLVYISCDPATLARDLRELGGEGFRCLSIEPFDMFPQTHHIETVALLEKVRA